MRTIVTLTKALRPWGAGDKAVLPIDVADRLVKAGEAHDPRPFPPPDVAPPKAAGPPPMVPRRPYLTRKRG